MSSADITCANINALIEFQALAADYGFEPTYLVSYEVLQSAQSTQILRQLARNGNCEIGSHLHSWTTPPFTDLDRIAKPSVCDLPKDTLYEKMVNLDTEIRKKLELLPKSYRGGRWGFNLTNAIILEDMGYLVDCSVTPYVSWNGQKGMKNGSDYKHHSPSPFFIANTKKEILLEVPVSIFIANEHLFGFKPARHIFFSYHYSSLPNKLLRKLGLKSLWLRPLADNDLSRFKTIHKIAERKGLDILEMMFHSYELVPGPFSQYKTSKELFDVFKEFFEYLNKHNITGITLKDYYAQVMKKNTKIISAL